MIVFPNAKINLGLHVINRREDGFHNLETTFLSVKLYDVLEVIEKKNYNTNDEPIDLYISGLPVEGNSKDNLISKAYYLMKEESHQLPPVDVYLHKNIPMGAGLGGGSSDAAFMLTLLNKKFNLGCSTELLKSKAAMLGSDCAFFIDNKTSYVFGKGHELEDFEIDVKGLTLLLICPPYHSSTALAYKNVSPRGLEANTQHLKDMFMLPHTEWKKHIKNDFEDSVFKSIPELNAIKKSLYDAGAIYASMSGSGSSIFGLFATSNLPNFPHQVLKQTF